MKVRSLILLSAFIFAVVLFNPVQSAVRNVSGYVRTNTGTAIASAVVSDGYSVVLSDANGYYSFAANDTALFVSISLPRQYEMPVAADGLPLLYATLNATGDTSHDFILTPFADGGAADSTHVMIGISDPQIQDDYSTWRFRNETIKDMNTLKNSYPSGTHFYGVVVGDLVWNWYTHESDHRTSCSLANFPIFQVIGNHDMAYYETNRTVAEHYFTDVFGPTYYSFNRGNIHYVILNDLIYYNNNPLNQSYVVSSSQMSWLQQDLAQVPAEKTVVLFSHVPINSVSNKATVYSLLSGRSAHFVTGHTHVLINSEISSSVYDHTLGATMGAGWAGDYCMDGTPNGYGVFQAGSSGFNSWYYKATGQSKDLQFNVFPVGSINTGDGKTNCIIADVWNYDSGWTVSVYEDGVKHTMTQYTGYDPEQFDYLGTDTDDRPNYPGPEGGTGSSQRQGAITASHMFSYQPTNPNANFVVEVTDRFGSVYRKTVPRHMMVASFAKENDTWVYKQDFNALPSYPNQLVSATNLAKGTFVQGHTPEGWYACTSGTDTIAWGQFNYLKINNGNQADGGLYSYGAGIPTVATQNYTERALGSIVDSNNRTVNYCVLIENNTKETIKALDISYIGEMWRAGSSPSTQQKLEFSYALNPDVSAIRDRSIWIAQVTGTVVDPLSYYSSANNTAVLQGLTNVALNGNDPNNRTVVNGRLAVSVAAGSVVMLRWKDKYDSGNKNGLAIDSLTIKPVYDEVLSKVETFTPATGGQMSGTYSTVVDSRTCDRTTWTSFLGGIRLNVGNFGASNFAVTSRGRMPSELAVGKPYSYVVSDSISGGIDSLWFKWNSNGSETGRIWNIRVSINGIQVGTITSAGGPALTTPPFNTFKVGGLRKTGKFVVKIENLSDANAESYQYRFVLDSLSWTNYTAPPVISYSTPNVFTRGMTINSLTPNTSGGGAVVSYSISPALPSGLSLNTSTGIISGTPTVVTDASTYTVTATNRNGLGIFNVSISVNIIPPVISYPTPNAFDRGTAITPLVPYNTSGATIDSYTISPSLPVGLSLNTTTGIISGTPTVVTATGIYTITATNSYGTGTFNLSIAVNPETKVETFTPQSGGATATYNNPAVSRTCDQATWTIYNAGILTGQADFGATNYAVPIRAKLSGNTSYPYLLSDSISGGIDSLWFRYRNIGTWEVGKRWNIHIKINGVDIDSIRTICDGNTNSYVKSGLRQAGIGSTGKFVIRIENHSDTTVTSGNFYRFCLDSLKWKAYPKPIMSIASSSVSKTIGANDFTNTLTCNSSGTISYSSSNTSVATVNSSTGLVHIVATGTTTITISVPATSIYAAATITYILTIKNVPVMSFASSKIQKCVGASDFTNTLTNNSDGTVTYSSSNTSIATVNSSTGLVHLIGVSGITTIAALVSETANYVSGTHSYTLTVLPSNWKFETFTPVSGGQTSTTYFAGKASRTCDQATWTIHEGSFRLNVGNFGATNYAITSRSRFVSEQTADSLHAYLVSDSISNGIDSLWFKWNSNGNETGHTWNIRILVNGTQVGVITSAGGPQTSIPTTFSIGGLHNAGINGKFVIKIENLSDNSTAEAEDYNYRFVMDSLYWKTYPKPTMSFATSSVSKTMGASDFTNVLTCNSNGTVSYSSSNTSIATVNSSTGLVHIVGAGTATITALVSATSIYAAGTKTYTLTVQKITPTMSFASTSIRKAVGASDFTNALTCNSDGTVTYSSSNPACATINSSTGLVHVVAIGSSTIAAALSETATYYAGTKTYSLSVTRNGKVKEWIDDTQTSLDEPSTNTRLFSISPTITSNCVNIHTNRKQYNIRVINQIGKTLMVVTDLSQISVLNFESGLYFMILESSDGIIEVYKFIKS